jgi:hypothetical protein
MYLAHCAACERGGIPAPTAEEWVDLLDEHLRQYDRNDQEDTA